MMSTRAIGAAALVLCLAVAACGGDKGSFAEAAKGRPETVEDLVRELYRAIARDDAATACALFTQAGELALLDDTHLTTCTESIHALAIELSDPDAYADLTVELEDPTASEYDEWCSGGISVIPEEGDDYLPGSFAYAEQSDGGWAVVGFNISECPA